MLYFFPDRLKNGNAYPDFRSHHQLEASGRIGRFVKHRPSFEAPVFRGPPRSRNAGVNIARTATRRIADLMRSTHGMFFIFLKGPRIFARAASVVIG